MHKYLSRFTSTAFTVDVYKAPIYWNTECFLKVSTKKNMNVKVFANWQYCSTLSVPILEYDTC